MNALIEKYLTAKKLQSVLRLSSLLKIQLENLSLYFITYEQQTEFPMQHDNRILMLQLELEKGKIVFKEKKIYCFIHIIMVLNGDK